ncbi:MAG TPA: adenylate/guanylate cyclase domain-containing protein [Frankiaceae bacterium]|nr:adenylate/guanylate cyclase domain-containing protein [Frankiaceae bacterium]
MTITSSAQADTAESDVRPLCAEGAGPGAGRSFVIRHGLVYTAGMLAANALGGVVTFVYAAEVVPRVGLAGDVPAQIRLNLLVFLAYLGTALLTGVAWSIVRFRPTSAWLLADRQPTEAERRTTLRQPGRQVVVHTVLWTTGVLLFFALNVSYSGTVARDAALATALGGLSTCAVGYLLSERLLRPVTALALTCGSPDPATGLGITARIVLAWTLGTGVPLLGAGLAVWIRGDADSLARNGPVLFLVVAGMFAGLASMLLVARSIAAPMTSVRAAVREVEHGDTSIHVPVFDAGEIGQLQHAFNEMVSGLRESERVHDIFGRQVGPEIARQVLSQGIALGGETRQVAVLFVDLVGSTGFASNHTPAEVVDLLNIFFGVVVDVIDSHGGVINKFDGDGALCVFGAPVAHPQAATAALAAGRILRDRVADLDHDQINVGIGISAGAVVAGNVGAESRFEYTVIGDPVNEASRLTDLSKQRPERLLASAAVLDLADRAEVAHWRTEEEVVLTGRTASTRLATAAPGHPVKPYVVT